MSIGGGGGSYREFLIELSNTEKSLLNKAVAIGFH